MADNPWTPKLVSRLRTLWDVRNPDGSYRYSLAEIGRILGLSKNAVTGKAHRLDLPPRPSPLGDGSKRYVKPGRPPRIKGPTLPSLAGPPAQAPPGPPQAPRAPVRLRSPRIAGSAARTHAVPGAKPSGAVPARPPDPPADLPPRTGPVRPCCWPLGDPGTRSFRFCDAASDPGRPYCQDHAKLAYAPPPRRTAA